RPRASAARAQPVGHCGAAGAFPARAVCRSGCPSGACRMAADPGRLMPRAAPAGGAAFGLAYCVPFVLWVAAAANLHTGVLEGGSPAMAAVRTLVLVQVLVAAIAVPGCLRRTA